MPARVCLPAGSKHAVAQGRVRGSPSGGRAALATRRQYRGRQQRAYMSGRRRGDGRDVCGCVCVWGGLEFRLDERVVD